MDDPRFKHVATDPRFKVSVCTVKYMCKLHVSNRFLIYYLCTLVVKGVHFMCVVYSFNIAWMLSACT